MLIVTYKINGAKYERRLPDTEEFRKFLWTRAAILISEGMEVSIRNR